jgi:hypothetical protein
MSCLWNAGAAAPAIWLVVRSSAVQLFQQLPVRSERSAMALMAAILIE